MAKQPRLSQQLRAVARLLAKEDGDDLQSLQTQRLGGLCAQLIVLGHEIAREPFAPTDAGFDLLAMLAGAAIEAVTSAGEEIDRLTPESCETLRSAAGLLRGCQLGKAGK